MSESIDDLVAGILRPDEIIIWIRRPQQGLRLRDVDREMAVWTWFWGAFPLFFVTMALIQRAWAMVIIGLPLVVLGLYLAVGRLVLAAHQRSKVYYILTDQRLVFSYTSQKKTRSFELEWVDRLSVLDVREQAATLWIGPLPPRFWMRGNYLGRELFREIFGDIEPRLEFVTPYEEVRDSILAARTAKMKRRPVAV